MRMESFLQRVVNAVSAPGITVASWAVLAMMVIAAADVIGTIFNSPITGAVEFVQALMVVVIFLALPYAEKGNQHISVDLFYAKLPPGARRVCSIVALVLSLIFFGAMAWQGWKLFWNSWTIKEYASGAVQFPVYLPKALFALGVTAAAIVIVVKLLLVLRARPPLNVKPEFEKQEIA